MLNEDRRCHRQTEEPTVIHTSSPVCQVEGPFNSVLHTPALTGQAITQTQSLLYIQKSSVHFHYCSSKLSVKPSCDAAIMLWMFSDWCRAYWQWCSCFLTQVVPLTVRADWQLVEKVSSAQNYKICCKWRNYFSCFRPCSLVPNTKHVDCVVIMVKDQYYTAVEPAPNIRWFLAFLSPKTHLMLAKKQKTTTTLYWSHECWF